jgi:hypothetical protein
VLILPERFAADLVAQSPASNPVSAGELRRFLVCC